MALSTIQKIDRLSVDSDLLHEIFHGGPTETVATDGGPVPTVAKMLADKSAEIDAAAGAVPVVTDILSETRVARAGAQSARDAALIQAGVYVDEPTGRAAVVDGAAFKVQGDGVNVAAFEYRRVSAAGSTLIATYPTAQAAQTANGTIDSSSWARSGYVAAIVDSMKRIALGIRSNGKIDIGNMLDVGGKVAQNASIASGPASGASSVVATPNGSARTNPRLTAEMNALQAAPSNVMLTQGRSSYAWPWTDSQNRVAGGLDLAGNLWSKGLNVTSILASINTAGVSNLVAAAGLTSVVLTSTYARSGYAWAVIGSSGRVPLGLDFSGNLWSKGTNLNARIAALEGGALNNAVYNKALFGNRSITCFGDSLTAGAGGTTGGWPAILGGLLARSVTKVAVGGQNAMQIGSRQGGVPILLTVTNNTIPASGGVVVTAYSVTPITSQGPGTIHGTLYGVPGTLSAAFNGDGSISAYTFTRDSAGSAVQIDAGTPFLIDLNDHDSDIAIYWYGRNDYPTGVSDFVTAENNVRNALAASIAIQKPAQKRFVIIGVTNGDRTNEHKGETIYNAIVQTNRDLRALYPRNFIDIRTLLVRAYDPGQAQDVIDFGNDVPPSSLRSDAIHLNDAGYQIVAQAVANLINQNGW